MSTAELLATPFDYAVLDAETRIVVQQTTREIRDRVRRAATDVLEIGERLIDVRARIGDGLFAGWLTAEFDWSRAAAYRFISVAERFTGQASQIETFAPSALYLLAAPSTPDEARAEALARAENGERVGHKEAQQIVAAHKPAPPLTPEPAPETFTPEQIAGFAREFLGRLDFHEAAPFVEAIPDAKLKAAWRGHMVAVRQIATFVAQGSGREAHARAKLITDAELRERLLLATQPALAPPADDLRRDLRSALIAGPHRWKDAQSLIDRVYDFAERSAWQADAARVSTADRVMRQRDAAGAWAALGQIADAELHEALLVLYAGAARELGLTWPPVAPDTKPSLPDGWRWRPGRDSPNYWQAERVADGMLTACGYSPEALAAEARAWDERKPAAAADAPPAAHEPPPPLTALDLQPLMRRAAALGYNVLVRGLNVELIARDKIRGETFDAGDEARLAARIAELEAAAATTTTTATTPKIAPPPADDRATYTAAERALADELAAASPRLRRLLMIACSDGDCERSDETDSLFDYLTDGLLAAESDILVWALNTPAPTPSARDWPGSDHPDLDDMTAELLGAEMSSDPPAAADVARWQDTLDAFAEELSDQTYQRLAHRIGEQRKRTQQEKAA